MESKVFGLFKKPYSVKPTGRAGLVYTEGNKRMEIDSEMLAGPDCDMVVYLDSMTRWAPPHEAIPVTPDDQARIRENIRQAFSKLRMEWQ
jgi:hypothetical protein